MERVLRPIPESAAPGGGGETAEERFRFCSGPAPAGESAGDRKRRDLSRLGGGGGQTCPVLRCAGIRFSVPLRGIRAAGSGGNGVRDGGVGFERQLAAGSGGECGSAVAAGRHRRVEPCHEAHRRRGRLEKGTGTPGAGAGIPVLVEKDGAGNRAGVRSPLPNPLSGIPHHRRNTTTLPVISKHSPEKASPVSSWTSPPACEPRSPRKPS